MACSSDRRFLFCGVCGTQLALSSVKFAKCPLCNFKRSTKEIAGREIKYRVTAQDIRRELGISTFEEGKLQLATITRKCEKCGNDEFEYTRKQMRSADEGQTTFLTCTKCRDTITEN
ncbi:DNA-directed RNA polymerase I subunit RPA12 [Rhodamnia argentea]|uniref:DNA-directed RNA polymerase subunit n=1 Tax=Rhodamnia argentea TaxID=178133 RepID=A0A8B8Q4V3_9MYRT|nr:DNA-directed RNA polymerase I subunit RPA12 [Rhodamnia argentea]